MDALSVAEQEALAAERPNLMSAFGGAPDFFAEDGDFTFAAFKGGWKDRSLSLEASSLRKSFPGFLTNWRKTRRTNALRCWSSSGPLQMTCSRELKKIGDELEVAEKEQEEPEESLTLLDLLFDKGLLRRTRFRQTYAVL